MGQIVNIRADGPGADTQRLRVAAYLLIGRLLRRAEVYEPWGKVSVRVYFDTDAEAAEFQQLVHSNRRRRSRRSKGLV